jgi:Na+:H+ antiporter, NhaA family
MDLTAPVDADDHLQGPDGADLVLVMYGDFECPYCAAAQSILRRVRERLGDRLLLVFRHLPIPEVHPHAQLAAEASEAAAAQGRFWEMHDALYANRGALEQRDLVRLAKRLGLDEKRFATDLDGHVHADRVARDVATAQASGVMGTPGFFANGRLIGGAFDAGSIVAALLEAPDG